MLCTPVQSLGGGRGKDRVILTRGTSKLGLSEHAEVPPVGLDADTGQEGAEKLTNTVWGWTVH